MDAVDCDADYSASLASEEIMLKQEWVTSWSASHEEIRGLSVRKPILPRRATSVRISRSRSARRGVWIDCISKEEQRRMERVSRRCDRSRARN